MDEISCNFFSFLRDFLTNILFYYKHIMHEWSTKSTLLNVSGKKSLLNIIVNQEWFFLLVWEKFVMQYVISF